MMSYMGLASTFSGFLVGTITSWYSSMARLYLHLTVLELATLLLLTLTSSLPLLMVILTPLSLFKSVSRVAGSKLIIMRAGKKSLGSVMGASQSMMSIAR